MLICNVLFLNCTDKQITVFAVILAIKIKFDEKGVLKGEGVPGNKYKYPEERL